MSTTRTFGEFYQMVENYLRGQEGDEFTLQHGYMEEALLCLE